MRLLPSPSCSDRSEMRSSGVAMRWPCVRGVHRLVPTHVPWDTWAHIHATFTRTPATSSQIADGPNHTRLLQDPQVMCVNSDTAGVRWVDFEKISLTARA